MYEEKSSKDLRSVEEIIPTSLDDLTAWTALQFLVLVLSAIAILWHLYYAFEVVIDRTEHANVHLALLGTIFYLTTIKRSPKDYRDYVHNAISVVLLAGLTVSTVYVYFAYARWLELASVRIIYTQTDLLIGAILMLIVTHGTWRAFGASFGIVVLASVAYGLLGPIMPGPLSHPGFTWERIIFTNTIGLQGVYGFIMGVGATWVAIFIFFAGIFEGYGGMDYLIKGTESLSERLQFNVAYIGAITSMMVGSLTGSSAANVATTGSFTIPLMKENGIKKRYAGAIESMASTGGQVLPPVMGSASFLMADILGIPYANVLKAAVFPALLFYIPLFVGIRVSFTKFGWSVNAAGSEKTTQVAETAEIGDDTDDLTPRSVFKLLSFLVPIVVLVYFLVIRQYNPLLAGAYTILAAFASRLVYLVGFESPRTGMREWVLGTLEGMKIGAENMAPLAMIIGALGIVVQILTQTGFAATIATQLITIVGGSLLPILFMTMIIAILFGMGMPTPAAYITVAIIAAPVLTNLGIAPLTAHMFVFYFAILSVITPPIALTWAIAAGIAGSNFWETSVATIRLGVYTFIVPFVFVIHEELITWNGLNTVTTFLLVLAGLIVLTMAIVGADIYSKISSVRRLIYGAVGVALLLPIAEIYLFALAILFPVFMSYQKTSLLSRL